MDWMVILASGGSAGLALAGFGFMNYLSGRAEALRPPRPPEARCSCGHGSGEHSGTGGQCAGLREIRHSRHDEHARSSWESEHVPCACSSYDGPDPEHLRLLRGV